MKASKLIEELEKCIALHGDLHVGFYESEYCQYSAVNGVLGKKESDRNNVWFESDDEALGVEFIALR